MRKRSPTKPPRSFAFFTDRDLGNAIPDALAAAGYRVERHRDHYPHDAADADFLPLVGRHADWIALTKDGKQRWRLEERDAIMRAHVSLFIHVGHGMTHAEIAESLVMQAERIIRFREKHEAPFIAKVYRPEKRSNYRVAPGRIEMTLTIDQWRGMPHRGR